MIDWDKVEFKNEKRFLSNMYPCSITMVLSDKEKNFFNPVVYQFLDGETYASTEHVYQACKSDNPLWKEMIRNVENPHKTKTLARKYVKKSLLFETEKEFQLRTDWDDIKLDVMKLITYLKYTQNKDLGKKLLSTEGVIEERNDWGDTYWGTVNGEGENNLGHILMSMRNYLNKKEIK